MDQAETRRSSMTYALRVLGGDELAGILGIPVAEVVAYLHGTETVPSAIFLKTIDVVLASTKDDVVQSKKLLSLLETDRK